MLARLALLVLLVVAASTGEAFGIDLADIANALNALL